MTLKELVIAMMGWKNDAVPADSCGSIRRFMKSGVAMKANAR